MGTVKHIEIKENKVRTIYLGLDDKCAGQIRMSGKDVIAKNNKWGPIKRGETSIVSINTKQYHQQLKEHNFFKSYPGQVQFTKCRVEV